VDGVFSASADDLKRVEGMGDKIAKSNSEIIESDYLLSPDEFDQLQTSIVKGKDKPQKEYQLKKKVRK
jgi:Fanconi anemia group M protein